MYHGMIIRINLYKIYPVDMMKFNHYPLPREWRCKDLHLNSLEMIKELYALEEMESTARE